MKRMNADKQSCDRLNGFPGEWFHLKSLVFIRVHPPSPLPSAVHYSPRSKERPETKDETVVPANEFDAQCWNKAINPGTIPRSFAFLIARGTKLEMDIPLIADHFQRATAEIGKVLVGQHDLVEGTLIALFCEGNVLIEGVPGLGKTLLVNTLSRVLSCGFKRVQFTPDLMPSDLTGHSIYNLAERQFHFSPGPIFTNLLLADEINRAPAKTQSALLEAMQERQVSVDGTTYPLQRPFITIATQNPLEQEGTYPLPEAQLDRFMFKLMVDYPSVEDEQNILKHYAEGRDARDLSRFGLQPALSGAQVIEIQQAITQVIVEPSILAYITNIITRTRNWHSIAVGASPRAGVNILLASRALAACNGRNYVVPDDVKELSPWVLRHRLRLRPEAEIEGVTADDTVRELLDAVEAPRK